MDDPNGVDERHLARYLASAGADYWLDQYVGAYPGTVRDVGIGKARYLTSDWLTLTMSTLPLRKLQRTRRRSACAAAADGCRRPMTTAPLPSRAASRRRGPATRPRGRSAR